jgi:hypothetical protein
LGLAFSSVFSPRIVTGICQVIQEARAVDQVGSRDAAEAAENTGDEDMEEREEELNS